MTAQDEHRDGRAPRERRAPVVLLAVLALLAATAAASAATSWAGAAGDADLATARAREAVLVESRHRLVRMNTLDHRRASESLDRWQQQVTGPPAEEVARDRKANIEAVRRAGTTTTARVLDAAVTAVDAGSGRAGVIAALEVVVRAQDGEPVTKRSRVRAELSRTEGEWKLSGVRVVGLSS